MRDWQVVVGLPLWAWLFAIPTGVAIFCLLFKSVAAALLRPIRYLLDKLYFASGVLAACCMMMILLIIVAQMIARWSGVSFQGSTEFAGYAMAATSFFALAHALTHGSHIRVSILLNLNDFTRFWLNAFALLIAAYTATYFARYAIKTNFLSEMLNDRTQGQDQVPEWILSAVSMLGTWPSAWSDVWASAGSEWVYTPVWLPQLPMSIGTVLLAVALWDHLYRLLTDGVSSIHGETVK